VAWFQIPEAIMWVEFVVGSREVFPPVIPFTKKTPLPDYYILLFLNHSLFANVFIFKLRGSLQKSLKITCKMR